MSHLELHGIAKRYGSVTALDGVDLAVAGGTLLAVLGPSGCGKTTLLRCVAGFERLDAGEVSVDGRAVAGPGLHLPPERRQIVTVPQEGALFPHLSVRRNIEYGLTRAERRTDRVAEVLALVGLTGYGDRMPHHLSGGQQQRVAVARAMAPRPSLILLDEPFSALDAGLRADLRRDVRAALQADHATGILVTHDQSEALSIADQVAVMRDGRVLQCAPAAEVYRKPADPWVAAFVGEALFLPARSTPQTATVSTALGPVQVDTLPPGDGDLVIMARPEQIRVTSAPAAVSATVVGHDFHGHDATLSLRLDDGTQVTARVPGHALPETTVVGLYVEGVCRAYHDHDRAHRPNLVTA
ncbi:ABC transporter ATP-binding protein [Acrocarpospora catenulata]|uniref:ABC transporter ATP-binding protein n=1 Tax=Acrocarpospora catenulata TaxID=2836182 RepID=UPI001BD9A0BE|nr:ABC transporter ATP-binding protein [Acrocarpospora catenulata]